MAKTKATKTTSPKDSSEGEVKTTLRQRVMAASTIQETKVLTDSLIFQEADMSPTPVLELNVALSGRCDGGLLPGTLQIAGPSKHFKTLFGLLLAKSFLTKNPEGVILFYDSEFGTRKNYFDIFDIDHSAVIHSPVPTIEELTHDILTQLNALKKGEPLMVFIDSLGNLASSKEIADAIKGEEKADMGNRAKKFKSLFRMLTTKLILKGVPMVLINHSYENMDGSHTSSTQGGTGPIYNSNDIWMVGRSQNKKEDGPLEGFHYTINVEKSRTVKEKSKFKVTVSFEEGIQRWSGLMDLAIEAKILDNSKQGWYGYGGESFRRKDIEFSTPFWTKVLAETNLKQFIEEKYRLPDGLIINKDEDVISKTE